TKPQQAIEKRKTEVEIPEWLVRPAGEAPAGIEEMGRQDMTLPPLGVCPAPSPPCLPRDPEYIDGPGQGRCFNTITKENYGGRVQLVPLLFYKTRILFGPMDEGGGLRCSSQDNLIGIGEPGGTCVKCPLSQFGSARNGEGKGTACNQFFNYA